METEGYWYAAKISSERAGHWLFNLTMVTNFFIIYDSSITVHVFNFVINLYNYLDPKA